MSLRKHTPQRTCLGCGVRDEQRNLLRLVLHADGELQVHTTAAGRGGYLHRAPECWPGFLRRKNTHRAFRKEITKGAKERLIQSLNEIYRE